MPYDYEHHLYAQNTRNLKEYASDVILIHLQIVSFTAVARRQILLARARLGHGARYGNPTDLQRILRSTMCEGCARE